jgi:hypothetical protein
MNPIYDKSGQAVAWYDNGEVLDMTGNYIAFINGDSIFSYAGGTHLGWFEDGVFWNADFQAVGMLEQHSAPVPAPGLVGAPGEPGKAGMPEKPGVADPPGKPARSDNWSDKSWGEYIL